MLDCRIWGKKRKKSRPRHYSQIQQAISRYVYVELKGREGAGFLKKKKERQIICTNRRKGK